MSIVRWGVLSTAKIGTRKVIPAMQKAESVEVLAIASRDAQRAGAVAAELGISRVYGSYEALLDDPEVDAVYNPLPNHLHVEWSIRAIAAGKHVLCEKPIGLTVAEAEHLAAAADANPGLKVMEAFMYRHHPQWVKTKQLVDSGAIGALKAVQAVFAYNNADPQDIRNQADIGGGGLMDIGCYPISVSRFLFGAEPERVAASLEFDASFGTDTYGSVIMDFPGGTGSLFYSTQAEPQQHVTITGTAGRIDVPIPFNAPPDRPCVVSLVRGGVEERIELPVADQYRVQAELMSRAILDDTPVPTPLSDAVENMRVIERCFAANRQESWA